LLLVVSAQVAEDNSAEPSYKNKLNDHLSWMTTFLVPLDQLLDVMSIYCSKEIVTQDVLLCYRSHTLQVWPN